MWYWLYLQSKGLNISWIYPGTIPFQCLKMVFAIQYSTLSLAESAMDRYKISMVHLSKSKYICFEVFEVWFLIFSLKKETTRKIYNQNVAELARCIIVLYAGVRYLLCRYRNFSLVFIFFTTFEAIAFPVNLETG